MNKKEGITPAALMAASEGDFKNAVIASTPGGIERQEAEGQQDFVNSETLPKECLYCTKDQLIKMGIEFGNDEDDIFVSCNLPLGWKKEPTDHSMWSVLLDEKGRERASIFYKAAFYDRHAHICLKNRYEALCEPEDEYNQKILYKEREEGLWFGVVYDCSKIIFRTEKLKKPGFEGKDRLRIQALGWLHKNYPDWENPLAYWS